MIALSCWCVSFMPSLFSNFLKSSSLILLWCSSASPFSLFHLEHWHSSSVIVFHSRRRRRMTESAFSSSHHTKSLVSCSFSFLPDVQCPDCCLPHAFPVKWLFVLPLNLTLSRYTWPFCFPPCRHCREKAHLIISYLCTLPSFHLCLHFKFHTSIIWIPGHLCKNSKHKNQEYHLISNA